MWKFILEHQSLVTRCQEAEARNSVACRIWRKGRGRLRGRRQAGGETTTSHGSILDPSPGGGVRRLLVELAMCARLLKCVCVCVTHTHIWAAGHCVCACVYVEYVLQLRHSSALFYCGYIFQFLPIHFKVASLAGAIVNERLHYGLWATFWLNNSYQINYQNKID